MDDGFTRPAALWSAWDTWARSTLFGIQIYLDFAAYSMIAIGSSRLMGIHLPDNFNFPYAAVSPRDFWKRWHISLSGWIRDYLYLPLAGQKFQNREGLPSGAGEANAGASVKAATMSALFLTRAVMGLWHGANWTFVMWGLMHAGLIALYRISEGWRLRRSPRLRAVGGFMFTLPMVLLAAPLHRWISAPRSPWLRAATMALAGAFLVPMSLVFLRPITQFIYFQF